MTSARLERYKEKVKRLEEKRGIMLRSGKYLQSMELNKDIEKIKSMIDEEEKYIKGRPVKELLSADEIERTAIINKLLVLHLAADFLTACCYEVEDTFKEMNLEAVSIVPDVKAIRKTAESLAGMMGEQSDALQYMLTNNETLNNALLKKVSSYLESSSKKYIKEKEKQQRHEREHKSM